MSAARPTWLRPVAGGVEVDLLVQPRASRSRVVGEHEGRLKVQLSAPPVDGEANEALTRLLAELLGIPRKQVVLLRGETGRRKTVLAREAVADAVATALVPGMPS